jgi:hypothetical protein
MKELPQVGVGASMKQNQWTSDLLQPGRIDEWVPPEGKAAGVDIYFSAACSIIESTFSGQGFHFHFTANTNAVPWTGPKSIIFVMSEENGLLPRYTGSVGAVFKCYGAQPFSSADWLWNHPSLLVSSLAKDAVVWKRVLASRWRWRIDRLRHGAALGPATVYHIPLGYHSLPPPETPPWDARVNDVFFAGSIRHNVEERKGIFRIPNPKQVVRDDLALSLERFSATTKWKLKLLLAQGFVPHAIAWGFAAEGSTMSPDAYMKEMANSKICLAPRGTSFETFRHYEAASAGCVVVSDRLPPTWFYRNIPFVFVKDWRKVDQVLDRLLKDPSHLKKLHEETLRWWNSRLSSSALAEFVIEVLRKYAC